jgi:hypothetical protein
VLSDLQLFADAGAWHSSERPSSIFGSNPCVQSILTEVSVFEIFGIYPSDATAAERTLSLTMQAIVANR